MQMSLLHIMLNDLPCYLHIHIYIVNILESKSVQVGHLLCPSRYAAFRTILEASARHVVSPLLNCRKDTYLVVILCACYCLSLRREKSS